MDIPSDLITRVEMVRAKFFRPEHFGLLVTKRIDAIAEEVDISKPTLWSYYTKYFIAQYEKEQELYRNQQAKKQREAEIAQVMPDLVDANVSGLTSAFGSAIRITSKYLSFKQRKHEYLLSEIENLLVERGGFRGLTLEDRTKIRLWESELEDDIVTMKGFIMPEKLVHYLNTLNQFRNTEGTADAEMSNMSMTFTKLLNMAMTDKNFKKPDLNAIAENAKFSEDLPEISGRQIAMDESKLDE